MAMAKVSWSAHPATQILNLFWKRGNNLDCTQEARSRQVDDVCANNVDIGSLLGCVRVAWCLWTAKPQHSMAHDISPKLKFSPLNQPVRGNIRQFILNAFHDSRSIMCSPTRRALATVVRVGLTAEDDTKNDVSTQ